MKIAFIGHRTVTDAAQLKTKLTETVCQLISSGADTFLFGSRSDFNTLCWEAVTELRSRYPNVKRVSYNAPNETSFTAKEERQHFEALYKQLAGGDVRCLDFESVVHSPKTVNATKDVYVMRNQAMIDDSDVCVFYFDKDYLPPRRKQSAKSLFDYQPQSGTALAFVYAKRKKKTIINLFE